MLCCVVLCCVVLCCVVLCCVVLCCVVLCFCVQSCVFVFSLVFLCCLAVWFLTFCLLPGFLSVLPSGYCSPIVDHARLLEYSSALPSIWPFVRPCLCFWPCLAIQACIWIRTPLVLSAPLQSIYYLGKKQLSDSKALPPSKYYVVLSLVVTDR